MSYHYLIIRRTSVIGDVFQNDYYGECQYKIGRKKLARYSNLHKMLVDNQGI